MNKELREKVNSVIGYIDEMFEGQEWYKGSEPIIKRNKKVYIQVFVTELDGLLRLAIPNKFNGFRIEISEKK